MAAIAIPDDVRAQVYAHARRAFPDECCGYLVGPAGGDTVHRAVACRNAQADGDHPTAPERGAETGFVIAGAELLAFARAFATGEPPRVVYHSHTHGLAYFSAVDRAIADGPAYPVEHLVVGVTADGVTEAAQFAWSDTARDHVEVARWRVGAAAPDARDEDGARGTGAPDARDEDDARGTGAPDARDEDGARGARAPDPRDEDDARGAAASGGHIGGDDGREEDAR